MLNGREACDSHHINEVVLERTYTAAVQELLVDAESVIETVAESTASVMEPGNKEALDKVAQEIENLQETVLLLHKAKQQRSIGLTEYMEKISAYGEQMQELEKLQEELRNAEFRYSQAKKWLDSFTEYIRSGELMNATDELMMRQMVECIIDHGDSMEIRFKCGVIAKHQYVK